MQYETKLLDYAYVYKHKAEIVLLMLQLRGENQTKEQKEYCLVKYEDMLQFLKNGSAILVGAFKESLLIGYAWGYNRNVMDIERIHITQIVVDKRHRKNGVGKALLVYIQEYAQKHGISSIELNVSYKKNDARLFYEKNGFMCESLHLVKELSEGNKND